MNRYYPLLAGMFLLLQFTIARAQKCEGTLGDPVIKEDFGSGSNPGASLGDQTDMTYTTVSCPPDGSYTIENNVGSCFGDAWQHVSADHTGNPNGYMMVINASYQPSVFFKKQINILCPSTNYEFSAYVLNLMTQERSVAGYHQPNIVFSIETPDGTVLASDTTGTIPPQPAGSPQWVKYSLYFNTPKNLSGIVLKMTNLAPGGNGNDLALDDIAFRPCGPVSIMSFDNTGNNTPRNICEGGSATYTLKAQVGKGVFDAAYQWQFNKGNGWTDITGETNESTTVSVTNAQPGTYQYRLAIAASQNISSPACRSFSDPLIINVTPLPVVAPLPASVTVCETDALTLTGSAVNGATYSWSGPGFTNRVQNPLIISNFSAANVGTYTLNVTSASGCPGNTVSTTVNMEPKVHATVSNDQSICSGDAVAISASGGLYYKWTPSTGLDHDDVANPVASPDTTTTYTVKVSGNGCYDDTKTVTIKVWKKPAANAGPDITMVEGQPVMLKGSETGDNITSVYWSPSDYLSDPSSLTPIANPPHDTTYTLTVTSACGISSKSMFLKVLSKLTIPNAFSPNGDGINDVWNIEALETYPESSIKVFNRYGQQVYQSSGYAKPWTGYYNGLLLPPGSYYYIIDLKNSLLPVYKGWVMIVR